MFNIFNCQTTLNSKEDVEICVNQMKGGMSLREEVKIAERRNTQFTKISANLREDQKKKDERVKHNTRPLLD